MDRYGCVPLPSNAPTANLLALLVIVSLRILPYGNLAAFPASSSTSAIGSARPWTFALASATAWRSAGRSGVLAFTPTTNTMLFFRSPASAVTASMTSLI